MRGAVHNNEQLFSLQNLGKGPFPFFDMNHFNIQPKVIFLYFKSLSLPYPRLV